MWTARQGIDKKQVPGNGYRGLITLVLFGRSDRVREAGEREVSHLQWGKQVVHVAFHTYCSLHPAKLFKVIEHDNRALVKPEILDRIFDLAVLDVKSSIAGQPCQKQGLRIN